MRNVCKQLTKSIKYPQENQQDLVLLSIICSTPQVNLDAETRESLLSVVDSPCADTFNKAQQRIYTLMAKDSFPRFLRSSHCMEAVKDF